MDGSSTHESTTQDSRDIRLSLNSFVSLAVVCKNICCSQSPTSGVECNASRVTFILPPSARLPAPRVAEVCRCLHSVLFLSSEGDTGFYVQIKYPLNGLWRECFASASEQLFVPLTRSSCEWALSAFPCVYTTVLSPVPGISLPLKTLLCRLSELQTSRHPSWNHACNIFPSVAENCAWSWKCLAIFNSRWPFLNLRFLDKTVKVFTRLFRKENAWETGSTRWSEPLQHLNWMVHQRNMGKSSQKCDWFLGCDSTRKERNEGRKHNCRHTGSFVPIFMSSSVTRRAVVTGAASTHTPTQVKNSLTCQNKTNWKCPSEWLPLIRCKFSFGRRVVATQM